MKRGLICEGKGGLSGFGRRCTCPQTKQCFALQNTQYIALEISSSSSCHDAVNTDIDILSDIDSA